VTTAPPRTEPTGRRPAAGDGLLRLVSRETASRPLAAARIIFGVAALLKAWDIYDKLEHVATDGVFLLPYAQWLPTPSATIVVAILVVWVAGGAAFTLGWRTRWAAGALLAGIGAAFFLDQQLYSNHHYLMLVLAVLFTLADSGATWSLDARRAGRRETVTAWPVDLLKIQLSIVYGFAAVSKLNAVYLGGDVLDTYVRWLGPWEFPDAWQVPAVLVTLAVTSIAAEAFCAVGFWFRRTRIAAVVVGFGLHAAIVATMTNRLALTVFSLAMFALYALFFPWRRRARRA
jgi:hypothetical protein